MPALPADIAAATRDAVVSTYVNGTIAGRYPSARDGSVTPTEGFFDDEDDAADVIAARGALIAAERRRFTVVVDGLQWPDLADGVPTVQLIDSEHSANGAFLVARIELDLDAETTSYELFG